MPIPKSLECGYSKQQPSNPANMHPTTTLLFILTSLSSISTVNAICCPRNVPFVLACCGNGPCNIFCCNCAGGGCQTRELGCKKNKRDVTPNPALGYFITGRHAAAEKTDEQMHSEADIRGVGHFNYTEFLKFEGLEDSVGMKKHFDEFDRNGDGVITVDEMRK
ncbi:hypothetical protein HII31_02280 [Pseudocercospora fuligena]|uniref:EF-hand domain-containing protein n=1 Tax=Pseudocercospora fuligena TaxID=685502 RepID=A0A8H6VKX0_9PEZI|nr:hypothetical protein HII31_02280 [Pseudocercospora fuligena]